MGKEKFEEFITQNDTQDEQINWEEKKQFFIEEIDKLYSTIDSYLEPYKDKIEVEDSEITIYEEKLGSYNVKKRNLSLKNTTIEMTPVGTILIGALGRVDMEGPNGSVKLVLVPENNNTSKIETAILLNDEDKKRWEEKQKKEDHESKVAKKVWKIATPPPSIKYLDLNEDNFFDKLMEVIDG